MADLYGPTQRTDSKLPHPNPIRRFREELRLDRHEFAELINANIDTLRVWETQGRSKPRAQAAMRIIEVASRNDYPLTLQDLFPEDS